MSHRAPSNRLAAGCIVAALTLGAGVGSSRAQTPVPAEGPDASAARSAMAAITRPKRPKFVTSCDAPRELVRISTSLPNVMKAVSTGRPIEIVALGSSSTAGSGASSPQASYPARLDEELSRRFPGRDFNVHNYGTGGHLARDMLERIESNILALRPSLVIWQTGVNDATHDVGVSVFREILDRGIGLLKRAGIDVILVDMQFYPRSERVANYRDYVKAMRLAADTHNVGHFPRYAIMRHMVRTGQHSPEQLLAPDNFHLNDLSYGCLADLMADGIEENLKSGRQDATLLRR